ncbi:basement membrane-specific heparan sulfate proteoglycan core protein-like isoform X4 [Myxocyprinus asiaticus]|uniref:basement membrane-specific heparan sulfate proteoglycan core protein-like isoform X4 n=1 Tax=Myxocyprinus asiaticus TaxID=70543 RepID=UPI00222320D3|nr:basement membrane-specific heparan sulfate proteoglycan core protein-like isoform X4 [Myxocyprinus asiaticus]XP_051523926.1 basement membrane-specific heparan sulfate proteoglycan core protein-like isoform X4 [Myxocyprinus asiaticus]
MESSVLPLLLLLMSLSYPGHTQAGAKPVLHVQPDEHVFRGETVTFTCDIQTETDTEWTYSYIKNGDIRSSNTSTQEFRISTVYESDIGKYSCRGEKSSDPPISVISDAVTLTVSATPKPVLTVMPQSSVFIGDTVNLSCEFTHSTGWKIHWYKNVKHIKAYSAQTETLSDVKVSDGGKYHCRAQRGNYYTHYSHTVMITVTERLKPDVHLQPDEHIQNNGSQKPGLGVPQENWCHIQQIRFLSYTLSVLFWQFVHI